MKRYVRTILVRLYRVLLALWWPILERIPRPKRAKRVLVCAHNAMLASYLGPLCELIRDDKRIELRFTGPPYHGHSDRSTRELANQLSLPFTGYAMARTRLWDLILFADNASAEAFHPDIPKIQIYHSLGSGKIIGGENYRYGRRAFREDGRPVFTKMLEASDEIRQLAIAARPALADVIVTVGDLNADAMLSLQSHRDEIRESLGFNRSDKVVLIQSTWGDASLMESVGAALIAEAHKLARRGAYRFILSTHPNHWHGTYAEQHPWGEFIRSKERDGFLVIKPGQRFEEYHVAADVAITDHTGLSLNFALLHKPMVFVPISADTVMPNSWEAQLYALSPKLTDPASLESTLHEAISNYPIDELRALSAKIDSCPEMAAERIREEIYSVLQLPMTYDNSH